MSGSQVIITSPQDDGDGIVASAPRIQVRITYTPGPAENPQQIEHETHRLQREADHIVARG